MLITHFRGIFYIDSHDHLMVADEEAGTCDVDVAVAQYEGLEVQLLAHHRPEEPLTEGWGGGCCFWQGHANCPFNHHKDPGRLFSVGAQGVLRVSGSSVLINRDATVSSPHVSQCVFLRYLEGHYGELLIVHLPRGTDGMTLDSLSEDLRACREFLAAVEREP